MPTRALGRGFGITSRTTSGRLTGSPGVQPAARRPGYQFICQHM
jgi:hypothetical protein